MNDVAITIASLGDFESFKGILDSIINVRASYTFSFYLVTPKMSTTYFKYKDTYDITVIQDNGESSVKAFNNGGVFSIEPLLFFLPHDMRAGGNFFDIVPLVREAGLTSFFSGGGHCTAPTSRVTAPILRFPCMTREFFESKLNKILFNESFKHHYCDCWLGTWCTLNGIKVKEAEIQISDGENRFSDHSNDDKDFKVFTKLVDTFDNDKRYGRIVHV